ncbi:MAG TPA: EAL domain-containing protein, partial [Treponema sp.]|nr:EAL domain-containing protein [Treponema sp.]
MKTELVAEGVETEEQLLRLRAMNIDYIQGYYYSRPLPPSEFINFLKKRNEACIR